MRPEGKGGFSRGLNGPRLAAAAGMDARIQLEAERNSLEVELLALEREWLQALQERSDATSRLSLHIESLFTSLELVNVELAAIRHRDESRR
ncbi:hypothetical protein [Azohydromonas caseinilytica]|jgi:hypothetical protein|uniref:Uncharacterized protein n=1 Tax=Azohydromonas caseinilytica TaxID=2728836 RepID=A0A848FLU0_9BURK|nr:hypothetical protein [Azohydromonas caseinilytica]NML19183.1 hypothetical protein [Azohydromonas caseinilytica]